MNFNDFKNFINHLQKCLYITDIETHEILFMNKKMQEACGITDYQGKVCWQTLQSNQEGPCMFCPIVKLKERNELYNSITWRENSDFNNRIYEKDDSLIVWEDGRIAHLQQLSDITDSEMINYKARFDDLCGVMNRSAGKDKLLKYMLEKKKSNESFIIAMLDINNLKQINDEFGYNEGDFLLKEVTDSLKQQLSVNDIIFRLGSDEFALVLDKKDNTEVMRFLVDRLNHVKSLKELYNKAYDFSFVYGTYTVLPSNKLTLNDIIAKADENMYIEKLRYRRTKLAESEDIAVTSNIQDYKYDPSQLYEALIKSTDDFIYICNMKTGIFRYSPSQVKEFNLPGEIMDKPLSFWKTIVHPDDWERFYKSNMEIGENKMDYHSVEFRAKNSEGEYIWLKCRGQLMRDDVGEPNLFAGIMTQLDRQNKIDPLTHLYNRQELIKAFDNKINDTAIQNLGFMIIDIDDFKNINEIYDRSFGDFIIKMVAQIIQSKLDGNMSVYKLDSDQLAILIENTNDDEILMLYNKIQKSLLHEQLLKRYKCPIQASGGVAIYPKDGFTFNELNKYADYSLQYAKDNGKNRLIFFSNFILENKMRSLEILKYIRESVSDNYKGFELNYQPQVETKSKEIKGVEALLRWQCPELGKVSPMEFVPILEESGLIISVGLWVMKEAIKACSMWIEYDPNFVVSINVSALQMLNSNFVEDVEIILQDSNLPPQNIVLELTESYMVRNMTLLRTIFEKLRNLGFKIAMDDFGTGYASLEILKTVPADIVKIDQTFVRDIKISEFDKTFIRFIAKICHDVDIEVLLEGIETVEEFNVVESMELDYIQGFLFGKPQCEDEITKQLIVKQNIKN